MIHTETAESMLDLAGYLNTGVIPNPHNWKVADLANAITKADLPQLARTFEHIATTAARIARDLNEDLGGN